MITIEQIKELLALEPHPEGGYFAQTYCASEEIPLAALPTRYKSARAHGTAIYYLLTPETCSTFHRLQSDEIFHFYLGDPVEMVQLFPDGSGKVLQIGSDLLRGLTPQVLAPRGVWQGSRLAPGGQFALLGCTVAPGFVYEDFEIGQRAALLAAYPGFEAWILALTQ